MSERSTPSPTRTDHLHYRLFSPLADAFKTYHNSITRHSIIYTSVSSPTRVSSWRYYSTPSPHADTITPMITVTGTLKIESEIQVESFGQRGSLRGNTLYDLLRCSPLWTVRTKPMKREV